MLLAEALAERAAAQTRLEQLRERLVASVRVQEGDEPEEDPARLIAEADQVQDRLQELVGRINATNAATAFDETRTISEAIAARDAAQRRHRFFLAAAGAASARQDRYTRTEVKYVAAYPVRDLRDRADAAAQAYRQLDTRLQQLNWLTELVRGGTPLRG